LGGLSVIIGFMKPIRMERVGKFTIEEFNNNGNLIVKVDRKRIKVTFEEAIKLHKWWNSIPVMKSDKEITW